MKFRAIYQLASHNAQSPVRVVELTTGREIGWINRYLDRWTAFPNGAITDGKGGTATLQLSSSPIPLE